jgi:exodeoxyribonuclease V beta subunit
VNVSFDLTTTSLRLGPTLLEASAGTGKTFSLAGLILRLVAEEHIPIKQILAVTYTIAATAELRERVRERLHRGLQQLRNGQADDALMSRILEGKDVARSLLSIDLALQSFDEAQVFTIHSFCQRLLQDYAFESGVSFDAQLVTDSTPMFQEVARDFWRINISTASSLVCGLFMAWGRSPDDWVELLDRIRNHPEVVFIPPARSNTLKEITERLQKAIETIRAEWRANGPAVQHILEEDRNLKHSPQFFSPTRVWELVVILKEAFENSADPDPLCLSPLHELTVQNIEDATRKNHTPPKHRFFELCSEFNDSVETLFLRLTYDFLQYAEDELPARKTRTNTVNFDDLILGLRSALKSRLGDRLAAAVGRRYRAVLVDEFQDTDPAQYEIFRRLFGGGQHHLYYIGDPKQAIYGFRGADVFTYISAAADAKQTLTLGTNWRAEGCLVEAVNTLFEQTQDPFLLPGISYRQIQPTPNPQFALLTDPPRTAMAPMLLRLVSSIRDNGKPMNKGQATAAVCEAVASDIAALQASGAKLGQRRVQFGDMAALVRTHAQAEELQDLLRRSGVRAIVQSEHSVFASEEAADLEFFLQGLLDSAREKAFKRALVTSVVGLTGDDLIRLEGNETERQQWLDRFADWRSRWAAECFIAAFRQIVVDQKLRAHLVQLAGGERSLTNYLHLAELLHAAETAQRLKPDGLLAWLRKERKASRVAQDEYQLRLESDSDAVKIVTIHKAKGLEYPIVFCPFLWTAADSNFWKELQFHDRKNNNALTFSLVGIAGGTAEQNAWATQEKMSEEVRMLYVAITRAKNRCTIYLPEYAEVAKSAFALLFPENDRSNLPAAAARLAHEAPNFIATTTFERIDGAVSKAAAKAKPLVAKNFTGRIDRTAMITSFSGLNTGRIEIEERDPEVTDPAEIVPEPERTTRNTIFDFVRGTRAGNFFHAVLERVDFVNPELSSLVDEQLLWHGFAGHKCRDSIITTLSNLFHIELDGALSLGIIPRPSRLSELEFTYRLKRIDPVALQDLFVRCKNLPKPFIGNLERMRFDPVEGYLRGFIDLLFAFHGRYFVLDWKSNWLGNRSSDYDEKGMAAAMAEHNYHLQAHLYVLAADLFLSKRIADYDYEKHFGGVYYVFLRGVDPKKPKLGVFHQRPSEQSVEILRGLAA